MRQPNSGRMTRSPGAVARMTRMERSRSSAPLVRASEPVWSTPIGQRKPRPMNDGSGELPSGRRWGVRSLIS